MSARPGSIPWLMHHELRLYWRGSNRKFSSNSALIVMLILLHLIAVPTAFVVKHSPPLPPNSGAALLTIGACFILLLMVSRGLVMTVQAFFARGDMDLLLSAPLPSRSIITVRTAAIAASLTLEFAILIWPFTNVFLLFGMLGALKAYILLPASGLLATSLSLVLALLLFNIVGARRTRVIAQVMSVLIAISFTLIVQVPNMLAPGESRRLDYDTRAFGRYAAAAGSISVGPALAVINGPGPSLAIGAVCLLILWLTTRELSDTFMRASVAAAGVGAAGGRTLGRNGRGFGDRLRFSDDTRSILIRKELRLIVRDPWLLSQILQQCLIVLPLAVIAWRHSGHGLPVAWATLIYVAGNLASALAWLTVSAEEAPELLATAPLTRGYALRAKLAAAVLPVIPIALLPAVFLWRTQPWFGFSLSACAVGAALSCASLNVRDRSPARRREFRQRLRGNTARAFLELVIIVVWVGLCFLMTWPSLS